eukprot:COSAG02_NODE_7556_length_2961_cov_14.093291_2_plen_107_part_00
MLGFCFTVLSAKSSPLAVEKRIEAFLTTWRNELVHSQNFGMILSACVSAYLPAMHSVATFSYTAAVATIVRTQLTVALSLGYGYMCRHFPRLADSDEVAERYDTAS